MARPRFDAKALAQAGLSRDQIRMLESLFRDVTTLADIELTLAVASTLFPSGRVLTDTATIDFDASTAGQMKASVIDSSITTTKLGGDITTAGKALLDDANAAAQLTTLGVSAYAQTLLDDANAAAAQTTLGISAFIQTLLDDANAAAARTTLGATATGAVTSGDLTMATAKLLGRSTAGTGAIEEITVGSNLTLSAGTLSATGGGSAAWTEYEVDFGSTPTYDATFTVTDAAVSGTTEVAVVQSGATATGRAAGDALFDSISYAAVPAAGSFTLYALASPGPVVGKRKILYQVGT